MEIKNFKTNAEKTWCPGCWNNKIESSAEEAFIELIKEKKIKKENIVVLSGIGCHGKITDYINANSFYSLHGRVIPPAEGIKLANPELSVIGFSGDGDAYGEGLAHLIFTAKRNSNITLLVHNNRNYALTTGQFTPTSPKGFSGKSTPDGAPEDPFNPLEIMLSSGASFIARSFTGNPDHLKKTIKQAILHRGFSFVDVFQPCLIFYNNYDFYKERIYELKNHNTSDKKEALEKIQEWDYMNGEDKKIPIGVFYKTNRPTFRQRVLKEKNPYRLPIPKLKNTLKKHI